MDIQFQQAAVERLRKSVAGGRLAHAWLFFGTEGVGKCSAARSLCEALLCTQKPGEGCGTCGICRRIQQRTHPDISWLASERSQIARGWLEAKALSKQPSADIHIEQIRHLQERLHIRALEGRHKIAVIVDAHEMNIQAQNALLKLLEEPPQGSLLLLSTSQKEALLPTIKSRCQLLAFSPLPSASIAKQLEAEGLEAEEAARIADLAEGSLGKAQHLARGGLRFEEEVGAEFFELEAKGAAAMLAFAERHGANRGQAEQCLEALLAILARKVKALARAGGSEREAVRWLHSYERVEKANTAVARNGAARLQLEAMLLEIFSKAAGV